MNPSSLFRYLVPLLLWMVLIFSLSTDAGSAGQTNPAMDGLLNALFPGWAHHLTASQQEILHYDVRKAAHVLVYLVLGALAARAVRWGRPVLTFRMAFAAWAIAAAYAVTDEFHQTFIASRTPKFTDVLLDSAGAALGIVLLWLLERLAGRRRGPITAGKPLPAAEP